METDYFECSEVCRITWITEFADPFADFQFVVRKPGMDARWVETKGLNGTTYFYVEEVEGPFYFEVEVRAIISWKITVEQLSFESLESSWFFLGGPADGILTGIFTCEEHCVISWMTEYEDHRWSAFGVGIRQLWAEESFSEWFSGLNGTTHLYAEGTFYFKVYTTDIIAWAIAIEKVPLASIEPETSFSGVGGAANTGIFMCEEHCVINWTAESLEYDWGNLMVNIREPGEQGSILRDQMDQSTSIIQGYFIST